LGTRPVEALLAGQPVDGRWCLIHATHMNKAETAALARSGAVAGLCPITEANLGDGIFPGADYLNAQGRFGVGSDSLVQINVAAELRQLEYSQRLHGQRRTVLTRNGSTGATLYQAALAGGAQALAQPSGAITPGCRADLVVLDQRSTDLAALPPALWLDYFIFTGGKSLIDRVYAGGTPVVEQGRHRNHDGIATLFRAVLSSLIDRL
jgi:formimidoylglutamate deiminase